MTDTVDTSSWYRSDVDQMLLDIMNAIPEAKFWITDYGFGIEVSVGCRAFVVMRPARPDSSLPQVRLTAEEAIEKLKRMRNN